MAPRSRRGRRGWRWRRCRPSNGATPPPFRVFYNYIHFFSFVFCCFSFFFFFFGTQFYRVLLFFYYGTGLETFRFLLALELVVIFSPVSSTHILLWGTRCNDTRNGSYRVLLACTRFFVFSSFLPPLILSAFSDEWVHSFYWLVEAGYIGLTCSITTFISLPLNGRFVHYFFFLPFSFQELRSRHRCLPPMTTRDTRSLNDRSLQTRFHRSLSFCRIFISVPFVGLFLFKAISRSAFSEDERVNSVDSI